MTPKGHPRKNRRTGQRVGHNLFVLAYLGLLVLQPLWHGYYHGDPFIVVAFTIVPLAIPLPALLRRGAQAAIWATYVSIFYFVYAIGELAVRANQYWPAITAIGLCLVCYIALLQITAAKRYQGQ